MTSKLPSVLLREGWTESEIIYAAGLAALIEEQERDMISSMLGGRS